MDSFLQAMLLPFLGCLLLAGIHVYLGIHVLARKVIFVDLALAQIAALGSVYGAFLGYSVDAYPWHVKAISLAFTICGAALFAATRVRHERIPHEAIIGITYAVALSAAILLSSNLAHGADELRELLAGSILWVEKSTLAWTALLYAAIGAMHFAFRRQFFAISNDPELAAQNGLHVRFWDFVFYVSFGFVVTSSVSIAGVLLVFSYLVIPAVIATLLAHSLRMRLIVGWSLGALVSFCGVVFSYFADLPSGPAIVVLFALSLALVAIFRAVYFSTRKLRAIVLLVALSSCLGAFVSLSFVVREQNQARISAKNIKMMLESNDVVVRKAAATKLAHTPPEKALEGLRILLQDPEEEVREEALRVTRDLNDPRSKEALLSVIGLEQDEYLKVEMAEALLELGEKSAIIALIDVMDLADAEQARKDAYEHLSAHVQLSFPFNAATEAGRNDDELAAFRKWWQEKQEHLRFDEQTRIFKPSK